MFLIIKILDLAYVKKYMRCLSQNKSDTKLFRVYLFTVFTLIVKTVTNKYTLTIICFVHNSIWKLVFVSISYSTYTFEYSTTFLF